MNIVWAHHSERPIYDAICQFVARRIWGKVNDFGPATAMGVSCDGKPVAGVVFHNWDDDAGVVEISAAADDKRWMTRPVLNEIYGYAFDQLGCQAVVQRIDPDDVPLARMLTAFGFQRYDIPRLRGRNKAEAVFVLTDDVWRASRFRKKD